MGNEVSQLIFVSLVFQDRGGGHLGFKKNPPVEFLLKHAKFVL